ncbi:MAG: glycoside hydrolase family 9 protein [Lachnospiraceae bacterium]|nr:glycoside hydrolase family 9 protein [Lachnospiraceae bacterium]
MPVFVDQVGYLTDAVKIAMTEHPCNYQIIREHDQHSVLDGAVSESVYDADSDSHVYPIDFSELKEPGTYYILCGNHERSASFAISDHLYDDLLFDVLKCLYYQRCGTELKPEHAGVYVHPACHLSPAVLLADYQAKSPNPQTFELNGGWHDAGDYGRYVSAGSVAAGHLLYAYERFPDAFSFSLKIPESGNGMPDILNECLWELKWLLKMQLEDGSTWHKVTTYVHAEFIMPEEDTDRLVLFPPSSMATADFAAVMALAARIYKPFLPEFADTALQAAKRAYAWLMTHDYIGFHNPEGCNTGEYDDACDLDERLWAAAELLRADSEHAAQYLKDLTDLDKKCKSKTGFGWRDISGLASMSILTDPLHSARVLEETFRSEVLADAKKVTDMIQNKGWHLAMETDDFEWGSNMVVLNRAMLLSLASMVAPDNADLYKTGILSHLHYLFGRNPMNTSYVTGYGDFACKNLHARVLETDKIKEPIPGFVSGGPFKDFCDEIALKMLPAGTPPMRCFVDHCDSYSTNEITIYWNTPLVFLLAFLRSC